MEKFKILETAMSKYPYGTKFKTPKSGREVTSTGCFHILDDYEGIDCADNSGEFVLHNGKWAEIIPSEPEKSGLLDCKCAIQIYNERQYNLLMQHYEDKNWCQVANLDLTWASRQGERLAGYNAMTYHDKFFSIITPSVDYKVIPFDDFAKEVGIDFPVYIMDSKDGVPLYEGDGYVQVYSDSRWHIEMDSINSDYRLTSIDAVVTMPHKYKSFHSKEAAEAWIKEQNSPKEVIVKLHGGYTVRVEKDKATFAINNFGITGKELEEIYQTYKSLK